MTTAAVTCVCWWCEQPGTVLLELKGSCGGDRQAHFCEKDARDFEQTGWRRVNTQLAGDQLALDLT